MSADAFVKVLDIVREFIDNFFLNSSFCFSSGTIFLPSLNQSMKSGGVIAPVALHVNVNFVPRSTCNVPEIVIPGT